MWLIPFSKGWSWGCFTCDLICYFRCQLLTVQAQMLRHITCMMSLPAMSDVMVCIAIIINKNDECCWKSKCTRLLKRAAPVLVLNSSLQCTRLHILSGYPTAHDTAHWPKLAFNAVIYPVLFRRGFFSLPPPHLPGSSTWGFQDIYWIKQLCLMTANCCKKLNIFLFFNWYIL